MNCPACAAELAQDAAFCQHCGAKMGEGGLETAPAGARLRAGISDVPEEVLWEGGFSPKAMVGQWLAAALLTVAAIVGSVMLAQWWWIPIAAAAAVWAALGIRFLYKRLSVHYQLTNKWLFHEEGVITRVRNRIELIEIEDVATEQSLLNRYFGVGDVQLVTRDRSHSNMSMGGVNDVINVATLIDKARRAEQLRRGIAIENLSG